MRQANRPRMAVNDFPARLGTTPVGLGRGFGGGSRHRLTFDPARAGALATPIVHYSPVMAPRAVAAAIPSVYQVATKAAACSGQCNPYSVAASAPAASPAAAPVSTGRVGASPRIAATRQA